MIRITLDQLIIKAIEKFKSDKTKKGKNMINSLLILPEELKVQICSNYLKERKEIVKNKIKDWLSKKHLNMKLKSSGNLNFSSSFMAHTPSSSEIYFPSINQLYFQFGKTNSVIKKPYFRTLPDLDFLKKILLASI